MNTKVVSHVVMVQLQGSTGVCARFSEAEWLKNQVKITQTDPEPFCDFRRLWYHFPTSFQPCKADDMACIRGPLGVLKESRVVRSKKKPGHRAQLSSFWGRDSLSFG
jgi:hypothetical protein